MDEHELAKEIYERAIYARGLFIQRYSGIEFSLTHLLACARHHPAYNALGDLPYKQESKLKRLEDILNLPGPIAPYASAMRPMVDQFISLEPERNILAHGYMARVKRLGPNVIGLRMYRHIDGEVHVGFLNLTVENLEDLADRLIPAAKDFNEIVHAVTNKMGPQAAMHVYFSEDG